MQSSFQARWITKRKLDAVRKSGAANKTLVLDSFNGFLIIEPVGSDLGDGHVLSPQEADYELTPVWCSGSKSKLREARMLVGLEAEQPAGHVAEMAL